MGWGIQSRTKILARRADASPYWNLCAITSPRPCGWRPLAVGLILCVVGIAEVKADPVLFRVPGPLGSEWYTVDAAESSFAATTSIIHAFPAASAGSGTHARMLTSQVVALLNPNADPARIAAAAGATRFRSVKGVRDAWVFGVSGDPMQSIALASRMLAAAGVRDAWPLLASERRVRQWPDDPHLDEQWGLNNTGQTGGAAGADINVFPVWASGLSGAGSLIAIVDDGFELRHPELQPRFRADLGWDFREGDSDASAQGFEGVDAAGEPRADAHGTSVAGIIGATANNGLGIAGVAWGAEMVPIRAVQPDMTDAQEAEALAFRTDVIAVSNNSWGPRDAGLDLVTPGILLEQVRAEAVRSGRNGNGVVFVGAAGNGAENEDDANYDGYANSPYVIAVGALNDRGERCSYSEKGACLAVSAPAGGDVVRRAATWTTDLLGARGYNFSGAPADVSDDRFTARFNGTSAAAPMVSGVVALMLEANPRLGWRDVKEILIRSAAFTDPTDPGWFTNAAGIRFNPSYGAGRVDADAAVRMSRGWTTLTRVQTALAFYGQRMPLAIPDGDPEGVEVPLEIMGDLRVETVLLTVDIDHPARGELKIELVSPAGTVARLWSPHGDFSRGLKHRFTSNAQWGEAAAGRWRIRMVDYVPGGSGGLLFARLELKGTRPEIELAGSFGSDGAFSIVLKGKTGSRGLVQRSADLMNWSDVGEPVELGTSPATVTDPAPPSDAAWYRWTAE